jgi:thiamine-monophosphate kinase
MMDVSDGLLLDAWRIAEASGVTLALDRAAIPVADPEYLDACIRWGDDYELLFTAPAAAVLPVPAHRIGTVTARGAAPLLLGDAAFSDPATLGYRHG